MKKNLFDATVTSIRNETPEAQVEADAATRVRAKLFGASGAAELSGRIRNCAGYQALIAPYLQKTLSDSRRMLLDDHISECIPCRRAFDEARTGKPAAVVQMLVRPSPPRREFAKWAVAAALLVGAGSTAWFTIPRPSSGEAIAQVDSVDGILYQVSDQGSLPVGQGRQLVQGEAVRAGRGSHSVVRLLDGSLIEMNERTELSVDRSWRGTTIHLERGNIIVQAAKQKSGKLYVASGESTVAVKGTIFAVSRGTKGTRVSVVEGAVQVDRIGAETQMLKPGGQSNSDPTLTDVPVRDEVAWSHDAARYVALLGELTGLERKLSAIPSPALRYQSNLLRLIPQDAMIFAAIPNAGQQLREARQVFEEQTRSNAVLADWWKGHSGNMNELAANLDKLQAFSTYVGDEVVVVVRANNAFSILAEAKSQGVAEFLDRELAGAPKVARAVHKNILVMASDDAELRNVTASIDRQAAALTPFQQRIEQSYKGGAGWLLAVDAHQLNARSTAGGKSMAGDLGIDNVQYIVLERREVASRPETKAAINFGEQRRGVASWLGAPGPLSTLDFVSPDAGVAVAFTMRNPRSVVEELLASARSHSKESDRQIAAMESKLGLNLVDDLAGALGSEVTFAQDGPLLPDLSWKAAIEVNAPQTLEHSIEKLVEAFNRERAQSLTLTSVVSGAHTFYTLSGSALPMSIHYVFADGYLIAAPSQLLLTQALDNRRTGHTLARSERFRAQLPYGANPNFSALVYHNISQVISPVAEQLKKLNVMSQEQRPAADKIQDMTPTLISVYGEPNRITISSAGGFFGMNLSVLAGLDRGLPYLIPTQFLRNQ